MTDQKRRLRVGNSNRSKKRVCSSLRKTKRIIHQYETIHINQISLVKIVRAHLYPEVSVSNIALQFGGR